MSIIFKLINNNILYELKDSYEGIINIEILNELFISWNFSNNDINNIKYIVDTENNTDLYNHMKLYYDNNEEIKNYYITESFNYIIKNNDNIIIYIVVRDTNIIIKLLEIFDDINKPININNDIEDQHVIDSSIDNRINDINSINIKSIELFNDIDFKNLLNIYIRRPELYSLLLQYIQNADISENRNIDEILSPEKLNYYNNLIIIIKKLGLDYNEDIIMKKLIKYNGHLNLTIRSLLQN